MDDEDRDDAPPSKLLPLVLLAIGFTLASVFGTPAPPEAPSRAPMYAATA
ncbi:MAG TPA: hypothetical protein VK427_19355 [Kofleriaceae bacterium]|nr:hypothetical protein [Kofleriaceae bacterium]